MSTEPAITEADRRKMGEIFARSQARSAAIKANQDALAQGRRSVIRENGILSDVRDHVDRLQRAGRAAINVREADEKLPHSATEIGTALSMLGDEGRLSLASSNSPKTWRIER